MGYRTHPSDALGGAERDSDDDARLRHARDRQCGFTVGRYLQPPPMLFTRDGHNLFLGDIFRGRSAFLICSGPSLKSHDLTLLNQRGILTCSLNNAATIHRSQLWICVDDPTHFADAIWRDPAIWKFVPLCHMEKPFAVRDASGNLVHSTELVGDMPAVFGFRRNEAFVAEQWLYEDTINWGNHGDCVDAYGYSGSRSVMLAALRLLFFLGIRRLFLIGCDFRMQLGTDNYAFPQDRSRGSVSGNNRTFEVLNVRLKHLLPYFEREGYEIYNCTPDSDLKVFPHISYDTALSLALEGTSKEIITAGMYDNKQLKKGKSVVSVGCSKEQVVAGSLRDEEGRLPPTTLITYVDERSKDYLVQTWGTWNRYHPWLHQLPAVVLHLATADIGGLRDQVESLRPNVRFVPLEIDMPPLRRDGWGHAVLQFAAHKVETPWYLQLDPEAIANCDTRWLDPKWFEEMNSEAHLAFVSCFWGYSKPADSIDHLDRWGNAVAGLATFPPLNVPYDPSADRVRFPTASTWLFMASVAWSRIISKYVPSGLPNTSYDTFVTYCARRRGDRFILHKMKKRGWEHSFRGTDQIAARCRQLLIS